MRWRWRSTSCTSCVTSSIASLLAALMVMLLIPWLPRNCGPRLRRCCRVVRGITTMSSWFMNPVPPWDLNTPITVKGWFMMRTVLPTASSPANSVSAMLDPSTTTVLRPATWKELKNCPTSTSWLCTSR